MDLYDDFVSIPINKKYVKSREKQIRKKDVKHNWNGHIVSGLIAMLSNVLWKSMNSEKWSFFEKFW